MKNSKKYSKKYSKKINTDKILFFLLFIVLSIVILSQIGLIIPTAREVFTDIQNYEGVNATDDAIIKGNLTMTMVDGNPGNNFEIMVNGEKVDVFDITTKEIMLMETSVVEIYAFDLERPNKIIINSCSDNLINTTKKTEIDIKNGYNFIGRYILKTLQN